VELPQTYVIDKFYTYSTKVKQYSHSLNGCCPICREGKSWNKKTRLFYFLNDDYLYCHNCSRSWSPVFWLKEVSGMSFKEIRKDVEDNGHDVKYTFVVNSESSDYNIDVPTLPGECVNLKDDLQLNYFRKQKAVNIAKEYCIERRLFTALNAPKTYYCCLNERYHGNRLIIPYYNDMDKIESYISRKILSTDTKIKYLCKFGTDKPIFNLHKVDENYPYLFIFEGQIDSMFVKNGIAISGTHLTTEQNDILIKMFPFHKRIWIFDNYRFEKKEVLKIIKNKLKKEECVFLYNDVFSEFKDLNEFCVKKEQDFVDPALIIDSSFSGQKGILKIQ